MLASIYDNPAFSTVLHEPAIAKKIFTEIFLPDLPRAPQIQYHLPQASLFHGNVLLAARNGLGHWHFFFGHFTGKGLVAAMAAFPIKSIFDEQVKTGKQPFRILKEMNQTLLKILPKELFCAASYVVIDEKNGVAQCFNGGMAPIQICRDTQEGPIYTIHSSSFPLSVMKQDSYEKKWETCAIQPGDTITLRHKSHEEDGMSLTYTVLASEAAFEQLDGRTKTWLSGQMDWQMTLDLPTQSLKSFDPMGLLGKILDECPALEARRSELSVIFAELFVNALEHGVLKLDSSLKKDPQGMLAFYALKERRLAELKSGSIQILIAHQAPLTGKHGGRLKIRVTDSGDGFDYHAYQRKKAADHHSLALSGRGIQLIHSLAASIEYQGKGNCVEVIYQWE